MNASSALGPFTFFFILYIHISVFCIVCAYYVDKWLLDTFYHTVICSWTGNAGIALTVLVVSSLIVTILMATVRNVHPKLFPSINSCVTLSMIVVTFVVGIRTRRGFLKDVAIYSENLNNLKYETYYSNFHDKMCAQKGLLTSDEKCKQSVYLYLWDRSAGIGSYIIALIMIFACVQLALTGRCMMFGPLFQGKGKDDSTTAASSSVVTAG